MSTAHLEKFIKGPIDTPGGRKVTIAGATSNTESFNGETSLTQIGNTKFFTTYSGTSTSNSHVVVTTFPTPLGSNQLIQPIVNKIVDPTSIKINDASFPRVYYAEIDDGTLYTSIASANQTIPNTGPHAISGVNAAVSGTNIPVAITKNGKQYIAIAIETNGTIEAPGEDLLGGRTNYLNLYKKPEVSEFYERATSSDQELKQKIQNLDAKFAEDGYKQSIKSHNIGNGNIVLPLQATPGNQPLTASFPSNANSPNNNQVTPPLATTVQPPLKNPILENTPVSESVNKGVKQFNTLVYPIAIQKHIGEEIDYLRIEAKEYKPIGNSVSGSSATGFLSSDLIRNQGQLDSTGPRGPVATGPQSNELAAKTKNTIILPIPSNISDSNSVSYAENELDSLSSSLVDLYGKTVKNINIRNPGESADDIADTFNEFYKTKGSAFRTAINAQIQAQVANLSPFGASSISPESILARSTGAILNPNKELLFNGVNTRQFKFSFKLTPRDKDEGIVVKQIIRTLKVNMAPKSTKNGNDFLRTPNIFDLSYRRGLGEHPFLNQFKQCALTSMNVNYTGDGVYATYHDSTPVSMVMDLTFKELEPIYDVDYTNSKNKGVGF